MREQIAYGGKDIDAHLAVKSSTCLEIDALQIVAQAQIASKLLPHRLDNLEMFVERRPVLVTLKDKIFEMGSGDTLSMEPNLPVVHHGVDDDFNELAFHFVHLFVALFVGIEL